VAPPAHAADRAGQGSTVGAPGGACRPDYVAGAAAQSACPQLQV
jgi:hypothetical protein